MMHFSLQHDGVQTFRSSANLDKEKLEVSLMGDLGKVQGLKKLGARKRINDRRPAKEWKSSPFVVRESLFAYRKGRLGLYAF